MTRRRKKGTAWLTAKSAIITAAKIHLGDDAEIEVGWVKKIGDGLFRDVYAGPVDAVTGDGRIELNAAALLPRWDAPPEIDEGAWKEAALLRELADVELPFRIPGWAVAVEEARRSILVRDCLRGIPLDFENPPALIDWEYSRLGDPAYDLAIVTRGRKRPFKLRDGFQRILNVYNESAEQPLCPTDVRVYEVYLYLTWFMESAKGEGRHPPPVARERLQALLRRIED